MVYEFTQFNQTIPQKTEDFQLAVFNGSFPLVAFCDMLMRPNHSTSKQRVLNC